MAEIVRQGRAPAIERVFFGEISRLPRAVLGDEIEIVEVFGEAPPRIPSIVEEIRADDVASDAPAGLAADVEHALGADGDLVDAPDFERRVMKARPLRREEGQVVMI